MPLASLIFLLLYKKKIRIDFLVFVLASYLILFFFFNLYFKEIRHVLGKKAYYFIYTLTEYLSFTYLIYHGIDKAKFRKLIIALSCLFIVFMLAFYTTAPIGRIDSVPVGIETILMLIFIFYFFYEQFAKVSGRYIYEIPSFWFVMGILIYLGGTFFFNILGNTLNQEHIDKYFFLSFLGDIIKNLLFTIAIIIYARSSSADNKELRNSNVPFLDIN